MSKKVLMVVTAILTVVLLFSFVAPTFAVDPSHFTPETNGAAAENITTASNNIIGIVQIVGTAIAIIMLIYLGIKYVIAAPDEKAEIKKSAFIYIIAAVFIFAAANILGMLKDFAEDVTE